MTPAVTARPATLPVVADRVVWLSGRSTPRPALLAPRERALLGIAEASGFVPVEAGFPFAADAAPWREPGLLAASARNGWQYAGLRWRRDAAARTAAALAPVFAATTSRLLVLCGSLGLELLLTGLAGAAPHARGPARLRVVALGPVCSLPVAALDLRVAQGTRDRISRWGYAGPVHARPGCDHLGYHRMPEVSELVTAAARGPW